MRHRHYQRLASRHDRVDSSSATTNSIENENVAEILINEARPFNAEFRLTSADVPTFDEISRSAMFTNVNRDHRRWKVAYCGERGILLARY